MIETMVRLAMAGAGVLGLEASIIWPMVCNRGLHGLHPKGRPATPRELWGVGILGSAASIALALAAYPDRVMARTLLEEVVVFLVMTGAATWSDAREDAKRELARSARPEGTAEGS